MAVELIPLDIDPFAKARNGAELDRMIVASGDQPASDPAVQRQRDIVAQRLQGIPDDGGVRRLVPTDAEMRAADRLRARDEGNRGRQITVERKKTGGVELVPLDIDPFAAPSAQPSQRGELSKGFMGSMTGGNPRTVGSALEGAGNMLNAQILQDWGKKLAAAGAEGMKGNEPKVGSIADVRTDSIKNALGDFFNYASYQTGSALGSMVPTIATGLAGAAVGFGVAGPAGAIPGGFIGATLSGYPMNWGDVRSDALDDTGIKQLIKDGRLTVAEVDRITALAAVPITALDSWSLGRFGSALTSDVKRGLVKRVVAEIASGGLREGSTEGLQQVLSEWTQQHLGSDKSLLQSAIAVIDNAFGGLMGGGVTAGVTGAIQQQPKAPAPQQTPPIQQPAADVSRETLPAAPPDTGLEPPKQPTGPTLIQPEGLPLQYPKASTYTQAPESLATQGPGQVEYLPPYERAKQDAEVLKAGNPLDGDEKRQRDATLIAIYGDNPAIRHVIEGDMGNVAQALANVAPTVERVRSSLPQAEENRDITQDIVGALDQLAQVKQSGQTLDQVLALHDEEMSYEQDQLVRFLDGNIDNPSRVADFLESYLQIVENMGGVPSEVRGRAFDIINERNAQRKQAEADKQKVAKEKAFKDAETAKANAPVEQAAENAGVEREVAVAKAAGSGLNPEHKTAIELAFEKAGKLKGKNRGGETSDTVPEGPQGSPQTTAGRNTEVAGEGQGAVPGHLSPASSSENQSVRAPGGNEGTQENRGHRLIYDKKRAALVRGVTVHMRAIEKQTGRRMTVRMPAAKAVHEINRQLRVMQELLACLYS